MRIADPNYTDGIAGVVLGPNPRYISNRIFNDVGQNLFSENNVSQWGWAWGQFIDHDIGLRNEAPAEHMPITFNARDPLETFANDLGSIDFSRTPAATGTGARSARQEINTISSYIDASSVYGVSEARLDWLREGLVDGDPANNGAKLLLPGGYLPRADARGNAKTAPPVDLMGRLMGEPQAARIAGDVRANENIALTAIHTLFAREHNRIVAALPRSLPQETRFQIARRIVGAEIQYITYTEFLPALGVNLSPYRGYNPRVNPGLSNEFATVGYRAHSMIHGQFDVPFDDGTYGDDQLAAFRKQGIALGEEDGEQALTIPLTVAFGNPGLLPQVGLETFLASLGVERQYRNDEQIDNTLRSVLFQIPKPGVTDPAACQAPVVDPRCFTGVVDLGAIDVARGRDHGMPSYNDMRRAYGLAPKHSFTAITGDATDRLPRGLTINDPKILDFVTLLDRHGEIIDPKTTGAQEEAVHGIRRSTLAARLKAVFGSVDKIDPFVGMMSERHLPGTEFGELQLAIWRKQFTALRDGDRYFYQHDHGLRVIQRSFGVAYRHSLAEIIRLNTGAEVADDVFKVAGTQETPAVSATPSPAPQGRVEPKMPSARVRQPLIPGRHHIELPYRRFRDGSREGTWNDRERGWGSYR